MYKNVGIMIQNRRKELGMSAEELGKRIGKNRATIYRYENGDIYGMPFNTFFLICDILELDAKELLGWDKEEDRLTDYARKIQNLSLNDAQAEQVLKYAEFVKKTE